MQKCKRVVYYSSRANRGHIIAYTKTWLKCFTHIVMYNRPNMQKCKRVVYRSSRAMFFLHVR